MKTDTLRYQVRYGSDSQEVAATSCHATGLQARSICSLSSYSYQLGANNCRKNLVISQEEEEKRKDNEPF